MKRRRGEYGIISKKDETFQCPKSLNAKANSKVKCEQKSEGKVAETPLLLESYYRLFSLYTIGLGLATLTFAMELTLGKLLGQN